MTNPLLEAALGLTALLEQENIALRLHDFTTTATLAESKRQAIASCTAALASCAGQADFAEKVRPASVTKPQATLRTRLNAALAENKRLLETSVKVQAEIIAIVLRSLDSPPSPRYRGNGTQSSCSVTPVALAVRA